MGKFRKFMLFAMAFLVGLYSTLVATALWNIFITPLFILPSISFFHMYGVMMLIDFLKNHLSGEKEVSQDLVTERLLGIVYLSVEEDKKEKVDDFLKEHSDDEWSRGLNLVLMKLLSNTGILILGIFVSLFIN